MTGRTLLMAAMVTFAWTATASAQVPRPERPYRGLFRGGASEAIPDRQLALNVLVGGGYDDNVLAEVGGGDSGSNAASGGFGRLGADLGYVQNGDRFTFGASVATDSRYFPELESQYYGAHSGSVGMTLIGRRTRLTANQTVSYQPFLTFDLFPTFNDELVGVAQPAPQEQSTPFEDFTSYQTSVGLRRDVSRHGAIELSYGHEFSNFSSDVNDLRIQSATGRYLHEIARGLGLRVGYGYSEGQYFDSEEPRTVVGHMLDIGVDFNRALSVSRRTTLSFATGSSVLKDSSDTRYSLVGDVRLNREIGRTWNAAMAYSKSASYVRTFNQPFFSNSVSADVSGLLNRRVELALVGSAAFGDVGLSNAANNGYESFATTSVLTIALTRTLALTAGYGYYKYNFESGVVLPTGLAPDVERQSAQLGLRMWVPLYRSRSSNASR